MIMSYVVMESSVGSVNVYSQVCPAGSNVAAVAEDTVDTMNTIVQTILFLMLWLRGMGIPFICFCSRLLNVRCVEIGKYDCARRTGLRV